MREKLKASLYYGYAPLRALSGFLWGSTGFLVRVGDSPRDGGGVDGVGCKDGLGPASGDTMAHGSAFLLGGSVGPSGLGRKSSAFTSVHWRLLAGVLASLEAVGIIFRARYHF